MAVTSPFFSYTGGERAERPSHTSQRSAAPAVAAKMVAGAMVATGRKKGKLADPTLARGPVKQGTRPVTP